MRPEPNNDIDLLLRQLSRRNGSPVSESSEHHLDADELNSYVANALPPAARARYTEHLADCSSCRKLAAQLSAAQGPVSVPQSASVVAPAGLKSFLASLFSPIVLRYAVPALGLIVIAVVGIFVFNQRRGASSVAQLTQADQNKSPAAEMPQQSGSPQFDFNDGNSVKSSAEKSAEKKDARPAAQGAPVTKNDAPSPATKTAEAASAVAAEPPPAAPKAAFDAEEDQLNLQKRRREKLAEQPARDEAKERGYEAAKNEPSKTESVDATVTPGSVTRKNIEVQGAKRGETPPTAGAANDLKRAPARATETARPRKETSEEAKDKDTALALVETRSVAGRRFRRGGSGWIDIGYDSSKSITTVARGSEQYRALVADEPSIRTIAEQLDGEIIVVWKSRTYRIR